MLTSCPGKNPLSPLWQSSLPYFFLSLIWSTLQWDDLFLCNYNTSLSPCTCLLPLYWGFTLEHPKPIFFCYLLVFLWLEFFFLWTFRSLLFSTSQSSIPFHTSHPMNLSSSVDQFWPIFMLMLNKFLFWISPPVLFCYIQRVLFK